MAERADVVFVDGVRTPFGRAGDKGMYWNTGPTTSRSRRSPAARAQSGLPKDRVDDVAIAATTQTGDQGLTLGRTAAILAGLPLSVPGFAIDRMCAGAMTAVTTTGAGIGFGSTTSPSPAASSTWAATRWASTPTRTRGSSRRSSSAPTRSTWAPPPSASTTASPSSPRSAATVRLRSQQKVQAAYDAGHIQPDLVPVALRTDGGLGTRQRGRGPSARDHPGGPRDLKTPFRPHGRVTAGNASPLTDGATAAIASADAAKELGLGQDAHGELRLRRRRARDHGHRPDPSTEKALKRAGLTIDDIGLFELNEAFAVQVLSFLDHFGIDDDDPRVNQWGGAIAIGHPLAASGVRLMIQLARQFEQRPEVRYGLTAMCVGLGQGGSVIWENPHHKRYGKGPLNDMTDYSKIDFSELAAAFADDEVVTHSYVRDITALGQGARAHHARQRPRPRARRRSAGDPARARTTARRADGARGRRRDPGRRDHGQAVHPRRRRRPLEGRRDPEPRHRAEDGQLGHMVFGKLGELGVPSFAFINGLALGGGLEIALNATTARWMPRRRRSPCPRCSSASCRRGAAPTCCRT